MEPEVVVTQKPSRALQYNLTEYNGTTFRSPLEARYAAFFDQLGWSWEYEPVSFPGWTPTFKVHIPCRHAECVQIGETITEHLVYVEVKPYEKITDFDNHPMWSQQRPYQEPLVIGLGVYPTVSTQTLMAHGGSGGTVTMTDHSVGIALVDFQNRPKLSAWPFQLVR